MGVKYDQADKDRNYVETLDIKTKRRRHLQERYSAKYINPIEEAWGIGKGHVGLETDGSKPFEQVKDLLLEGFAKVNGLWPELVRRACKHEMIYIEKDNTDVTRDPNGSWEVNIDESSEEESGTEEMVEGEEEKEEEGLEKRLEEEDDDQDDDEDEDENDE
ncbi:hypothetical protein EC968_009404 [Mortierella alpina]|nr:hypothetical protein EC968_009404 [Mortierella alpina]